MNYESYLDPNLIRAHCNGAIQSIDLDKEALLNARNAITMFMDEAKLQGNAFATLKSSMAKYVTFIDYLLEADQLDKNDFLTLSKSVGNEILNGKEILDNQEAALQAKADHEETAREYREKEDNAVDDNEREHYSSMAHHYDDLAAKDYEVYLYWKAKEEKYDEIESNTQGLFYEGQCQRLQCLADPNNPNSIGLTIEVDNPCIDDSVKNRIRTQMNSLPILMKLYDEICIGNVDPVTLPLYQKMAIVSYYEKTHKDHAKAMDNILKQAEEEGYTEEVLNIKAILYTAPEPYRSALLNNINNVLVKDLHFSGTPYYYGGELYYNIEAFSTEDIDGDGNLNEANNYEALIHELAHAADAESHGKMGYNYTYFYKNKNNQTLTDVLENEVRTRISDEIDNGTYGKLLNDEQKKEVLEAMMNTEDYVNHKPEVDDFSCKACYDCYDGVRAVIIVDYLQLGDRNYVQDIYGGLTGNSLLYSDGHPAQRYDGRYYWIESKKDWHGDYHPVHDRKGHVKYTSHVAAEFFAESMTAHITGAKGCVGMDSYNYYSDDTKAMFEEIVVQMAE